MDKDEVPQCKEFSIKSLIHNRLFSHSYQPIYDLHNWCIYGYEAFFRSNFPHNPEEVFQIAKKNKQLYELDTASIFNAALSYFISKENINLGAKGNLFINIFPSTLLHPSFSDFLEKLIAERIIIRSKCIVFEINESETIWDFHSLSNVIELLRQNGFRVAFDNVGKGAASLQNIIEFEPDFIKLDQYFSMDLAISEKKQKVLQLFVDYCKHGPQLILEGIETEQDLAIAKLIGVPIGQGYILSNSTNISKLGEI